MDKRLLPDFELPSIDGQRTSTEDYGQHRELLVAILHGASCDPCHTFARVLEASGAGGLRGAVALGIFEGEQGARSAPRLTGDPDGVRWLVDSTGGSSRRLRAAAGVPGGAASLLVSDRFGVLYAALGIHGHDAKAVLDDALEWIDFIQMQCPECGVPVW